MPRRLLAGVGALTLALLATFVPDIDGVHAATAHCTGWSSTTRPPSTIRVYRSGLHRTVAVDFTQYVRVVVANEWGPTHPRASLRAGAIAIKQYGWYFAMHWRRGRDRRCHGTGDRRTRDVGSADRRSARIRQPARRSGDGVSRQPARSGHDRPQPRWSARPRSADRDGEWRRAVEGDAGPEHGLPSGSRLVVRDLPGLESPRSHRPCGHGRLRRGWPRRRRSAARHPGATAKFASVCPIGFEHAVPAAVDRQRAARPRGPVAAIDRSVCCEGAGW